MKKGDIIEFGGDRNWGKYEGEILGELIMSLYKNEDPEEHVYKVKITKLIDNQYNLEEGYETFVAGYFDNRGFSIDPYIKEDLTMFSDWELITK